MDMDKEKSVPKELSDIMDTALAAKESRDAAAKGFFKFQLRNSLYFGEIYQDKSREFWTKIYAIYPELKDLKLTYDSIRRILKIEN